MSRNEVWGDWAVRISLSVLVLAWGAALAWPQGFQGTIRGSVQDATGAVISGASVTASNVGTGESRQQLATTTGTFSFPNLLVGNYTVTVEMPGFRRHVRENVQVNANTVSDVLVLLEVGGITEEVSVVAGAEPVTISTAQLQGIITRDVVELPNAILDGSPNNLAILAPGTTTQPGGVVGQGGSIGGNRPRQNNFTVDGVDNNDPGITGPLAPVIGEAVEEFTLLTNQFSAEYGHSTAGQFITTTKSGTNELHGRAWWYNQNRHTNSLDNLRRAATPPGSPKPRYDRNRFGGQAGGPVIGNKLFYFGAYEYQNLTLAGAPSGRIRVPTADGLTLLQNLANTPGTGVSPAAVGLLASHVPPAATQTQTFSVTNEATGTQIPIPFGEFSATTPNFDRSHLATASSDFQTLRHRLSGRYSYARNPIVQAAPLPVEKFNTHGSKIAHRITLSDVFTAGANVVNEFRAGYSRVAINFPVELPPPPGNTDVFGNYNILNLSLFIGPPSTHPQTRFDNIYNFTNNTSVILGAHTLKFGAEVRNYISTVGFLPSARGEFVWGSLDDFVRDTFPAVFSTRGVGKGPFTHNRTAYYAFLQDSWKLHPQVNLEYGIRYEYTSSARDNQLHDLNGISNIISIRDEVFPQGHPQAGERIFDSLPSAHQQALLGHVGEQLLFKRPNADRNNVAPRIGVAWDIFGDGRTSLRAGAGIAHDVIYANLPQLMIPPQLRSENRETNACTLTPRPAWCSQVGDAGNPRQADIRHSTIGFLAGGGLLPTLPPDTRIDRASARAATAFWMPDERVPETYTWSLSLQREVIPDWTVEARYIGNHTINLPVQRWKNAAVPNPVRLPLFLSEADARQTNFAGQPTLADFQANLFTPAGPNFLLRPYGFNGVLTTFSQDGQSWYHGGSIEVRKRMSRGLQFNASYTWSKTLDVIENDLASSALNPRRPSNHLDIFENKGPSGLHRAHKFVLNWIYDLPRYPGDGALSKVFSGWRLNGTYIAESGQPVSLISFRDVSGSFDTAASRVFFNPNGQKNVGSDVDFVCWSNAAVDFARNAAGCGGGANVVGYIAQNPNAQYIRGQSGMITNLGRGTFEMPGINTWNLALSKRTPFWGEGRELEFRVEMWNAFNHPNFILGTGAVTIQTSAAQAFPEYVTPGSPQFLDKTIFSGGLGNAPFQRIIQWGLKLHF